MVNRIQPISKPTRLNKENLTDLLNEAITQINEIHSLYEKFFAAGEDGQSYLQKVESKLEVITLQFSELFDGSPSRVVAAEEALENIKDYHAKLLEGDDSIQADINDFQNNISAFYDQLFVSSDDGTTKDGGKKAVVEAAIKSITDFDAKLNNTASGYKFEISKARDDILKAHSELFKKNKSTGKSASDQLNEEITATHNYHEKVTKEITPFINDKKSEIITISEDIASKQAEVDSLLSNATVRTLAEGYSQSMETYGSPIIRKAPSVTDPWQFILYLCIQLWNQIKYFLKFVASYILFIGPLLLIGALFVVNNTSILGIDLATHTIQFSGTEYILYKLTIALPLLWVSWYGQRSISHRKRLFEEYNHKLRVIQMYMLFTAQKNTYTLSEDAMKNLEKELLETIARNPSQVYGKDETMIDKIIALFASRRVAPNNPDQNNGHVE